MSKAPTPSIDSMSKPLQVHAKFGEPLRYFEECLKLETDECILWKYATSRSHHGYGHLTRESSSSRVHRLALIQRVGEPPQGKTLALHKPQTCHNRLCFNYRHLYWGTAKQNQADRILDGTSNRGRVRADKRGENHHCAKLREEQVRHIRNDSRSLGEIAADYGLHTTTISLIKRGKSWSWLK